MPHAIPFGRRPEQGVAQAVTAFRRHGDEVRPYVPCHPHDRFNDAAIAQINGGKAPVAASPANDGRLLTADMEHLDAGIGRDEIDDGLDLPRDFNVYL